MVSADLLQATLVPWLPASLGWSEHQGYRYFFRLVNLAKLPANVTTVLRVQDCSLLWALQGAVSGEGTLGFGAYELKVGPC